MSRKHYLIRLNGEAVMKGDVYALADFLGRKPETIQQNALKSGIITSSGKTYSIEMFEQLYQFIDQDNYVVYEGPLNECAEEMFYSASYIVSSACNQTKIDNYTVKKVEYLEGYGYYE